MSNFASYVVVHGRFSRQEHAASPQGAPPDPARGPGRRLRRRPLCRDLARFDRHRGDPADDSIPADLARELLFLADTFRSPLRPPGLGPVAGFVAPSQEAGRRRTGVREDDRTHRDRPGGVAFRRLDPLAVAALFLALGMGQQELVEILSGRAGAGRLFRDLCPGRAAAVGLASSLAARPGAFKKGGRAKATSPASSPPPPRGTFMMLSAKRPRAAQRPESFKKGGCPMPKGRRRGPFVRAFAMADYDRVMDALGGGTAAPQAAGPGQPGPYRETARPAQRLFSRGRRRQAASSARSWRPTTAARAGSTGWPWTRPGERRVSVGSSSLKPKNVWPRSGMQIFACLIEEDNEVSMEVFGRPGVQEAPGDRLFRQTPGPGRLKVAR